MTRILLSVAGWALLLLLLHRGWNFVEASWFRSLMPKSLEVGEPVLIRDVGAIREGCGVAIFMLDDAALKRIESQGVTYLGDTWKETPYPPGGSGADSWLTGMSEGCGDLPDDMRAQVHDALGTPGAFYALGHEKGYIVIPRLGWAVLSFFG